MVAQLAIVSRPPQLDPEGSTKGAMPDSTIIILMFFLFKNCFLSARVQVAKVHYWCPVSFYLIYENKPWSVCCGCGTTNPGEMSGKQRDCSFFEISYFCSFFVSEGSEEGGIWGDLARRRVPAGAVGNVLDVGDRTVTTIGVMERNSLFLEILRDCVELLWSWKVLEVTGLRARWEERISPTLAHVGQGKICFQTFYFNVSPEFLLF